MKHHDKTPDQSGWYIVDCGSEDRGPYTAYLSAKEEPRRVDLFVPCSGQDFVAVPFHETAQGAWEVEDDFQSELVALGIGSVSGPSRWFGPVPAPLEASRR